MVTKSLAELIFEEDEDYRGLHKAPGPGSGAPLYDLTQILPDDVYGPNAAQYYGAKDARFNDYALMNLLKFYRNKPNAKIRIYRAIPKLLTIQDKIADFEAQKRYIMAKGKIPKGVKTPLNPSRYYEQISNTIEILKKQAPEQEEKLKINNGDWVTIVRNYAVEHGKSEFKGKYRILTKTVKASQLYTNGDSLFEFGYWE
jgi:hypothetical protein